MIGEAYPFQYGAEDHLRDAPIKQRTSQPTTASLASDQRRNMAALQRERNAKVRTSEDASGLFSASSAHVTATLATSTGTADAMTSVAIGGLDGRCRDTGRAGELLAQRGFNRCSADAAGHAEQQGDK